MKALIVSLLLAATATATTAQTMSTPNEAGGRIVLTDKPCVFDGENFKALRAAYTYGKGAHAGGCWALFDSVVKIVWRDGSPISEYSVMVFEEDTSAQKPKSSI